MDSPAIVVRLEGGLGNQLFQYALARALAEERGAHTLLDLESVEGGGSGHFRLGCFCIPVQTVGREEGDRLRWRRPSWVTRLRWLLCRSSQMEVVPAPSRVLERQRNQYDPTVWSVSPSVYLEGYWQCYQYVDRAAESLRLELRFRHPPDGRNAEMLERIGECRSVSVHVRRGDYLSAAFRGKYAQCSLAYYEDASRLVASRLANPVFYVFSDDPEWCRENLRLAGERVIVDHNGPERASEDLRLMASCAHAITANSTLSWWGAWLGASKEQIVVSPSDWYRDGRSTDDLVPPAWIRI